MMKKHFRRVGYSEEIAEKLAQICEHYALPAEALLSALQEPTKPLSPIFEPIEIGNFPEIKESKWQESYENWIKSYEGSTLPFKYEHTGKPIGRIIKVFPEEGKMLIELDIKEDEKQWKKKK